MNIIFDIGNVLLSYAPHEFVVDLIGEGHEAEAVFSLIFRGREWAMLDEGTLSNQEAESIFTGKQPELAGEIGLIMGKLNQLPKPMEQTLNLLPKLKNAGNKLYYLSNYPREMSCYIRNKYSFFECFEGGVFSWEVRLLKPNPMIYQFLLEKYSLKAHECIFFDDAQENVAAANEVGINGVLFTGAESAAAYLRGIL